MRLTREERRLLVGYVHNMDKYHGNYFNTPKVGNEIAYETERLQFLLEQPFQKVWSYFENDKPDIYHGADYKAYHELFCDRTKRVEHANEHLEQHKLITTKPHQNAPVVFVALTLEGYDLGRKLSTKFGVADNWVREQKGGLLALIGSFVSGLIVGILSKIVVDYLTQAPGKP